MGGGIDGSNVPDSIEACPQPKNILNEDVVRSTSVKNTYGSFIKGKVSFIRKLDAAFASLKAQGYIIGPESDGKTNAPVGDSFRSFDGQRKGHINILNARKLWKEGKPWSKNHKVKTPDGPSGSQKPPWVADPCKGYHTHGQAIDLYQGATYRKNGASTKFKDDIIAHGPLYSALYDAGVRRIGNEWWHWGVGEVSR